MGAADSVTSEDHDRPDRLVVHVLSDMRSGSTLLDQLLGAHPAIMSLGELHWLSAYATQDRSIYDPEHELLCTCGMTLGACPFWSMVASSTGTSLKCLRLRPSFNWLSRRIFLRIPELFRRDWLREVLLGRDFLTDSLTLIDAIFCVSDRSIIVDSSKSTLRFRAAFSERPSETRCVILTRDYRAVVHSKMKRGHTLESAAIGWRNKMREIAALTDDLPDAIVARVSYESLCSEPVQELSRLCHFLGVGFAPTMLTRDIAGSHHIGGSPSKFDPAKTGIAMDTGYLNAFGPAQLSLLDGIVGKQARRWGY